MQRQKRSPRPLVGLHVPGDPLSRLSDAGVAPQTTITNKTNLLLLSSSRSASHCLSFSFSFSFSSPTCRLRLSDLLRPGQCHQSTERSTRTEDAARSKYTATLQSKRREFRMQAKGEMQMKMQMQMQTQQLASKAKARATRQTNSLREEQ